MSDTYEATALFLRQRVLILQARLAEAYERHSRYVKGVGELADRAARVSEIIAYCAQEGNDGEPYDTINAIATGEYSTRGGGE